MNTINAEQQSNLQDQVWVYIILLYSFFVMTISAIAAGEPFFAILIAPFFFIVAVGWPIFWLCSAIYRWCFNKSARKHFDCNAINVATQTITKDQQ